MKEKKPRGRPKGYKVTDETKKKTSKSRTGQKHSNNTKKKIRRSLYKFFAEHPDTQWGSVKIHGESFTTLWNKWIAIKQRCYNPKNKWYKYYGAKNIGMCNEWREDYITFRDWCLENGWKKKLCLHRIDPSGDYCHNNCVFMTNKEHSKLHGKIRRETLSNQ